MPPDQDADWDDGTANHAASKDWNSGARQAKGPVVSSPSDYTHAREAYQAFCAELARARNSMMSGDKPEPRSAWEFLSVTEKSAWLEACKAVRDV